MNTYNSSTLVPLRVPFFRHGIVSAVKQLLRALKGTRPVNLLGDRDIEWSWIAANMPFGPGNALDFGSGNSSLALIAAQRGFIVTAVDLLKIEWPYIHSYLNPIQGDLLKLPLQEKNFDLVINCSTVEHVGLVGRYGVSTNIPNGDLYAMNRLKHLMKPGGIMLITIPVGLDAIFPPLCRVYGAQRLPLLLDGFVVEKERFWLKNSDNKWVLSKKEEGLTFKSFMGSWDVQRNVCGLGCFVLKRP